MASESAKRTSQNEISTSDQLATVSLEPCTFLQLSSVSGDPSLLKGLSDIPTLNVTRLSLYSVLTSIHFLYSFQQYSGTLI